MVARTKKLSLMSLMDVVVVHCNDLVGARQRCSGALHQAILEKHDCGLAFRPQIASSANLDGICREAYHSWPSSAVPGNESLSG